MNTTNTKYCEVCDKHIHTASFSRHEKSKIHLHNIGVVPGDPIQRRARSVPTLKQLARAKVNLSEKELAKHMINPYYFSKRYEPQYDVNLDQHHPKHLNSKITVKPKYDLPIELLDLNNIFKEMSAIYARLIEQYKFKYQVVFSVIFDKETRDELEQYVSLEVNQSLTWNDIEKYDLEEKTNALIENLEMKDSGWRFCKITSMIIYFYKTVELNGSSYVKIPLRSAAILNIENDDKYCFLWSILAHLHPCENSHPNRVSNYREYFRELKTDGLEFPFKTSDVSKFEKMNNLAINIFELQFYQEGEKWKHKLIPIEVSENNSETVIDLVIYKNHYALIKKLHVFLGKRDSKFVCRRCLSCFTNENVLVKHTERCKQQDITAIRVSKDSHLMWKKHFHKIPLYFRIYGDFECNNKREYSNIGNKTTNIFRQNPMCNGFYIVSEMDNVLQSGWHLSPFGEDNVEWFVNEVIKIENKMNFYFKNTKKEIMMTQEDEEDFKNSTHCWFCELPLDGRAVRDHCHLTGRYRGAAHEKCNINVKQKQSNFIPFVFHNFSNYDCHLFFKTLIDKKSDNVPLHVIPKTNEEYISISYGCIRFIDSYRFLSSSLDGLVKTVDELTILKREFPDNWELLSKKLAYPYEYFKSLDDYQLSVKDLVKEDYFSRLKNGYPQDSEIQRTNEIIETFKIKTGKELTELYLKTDVVLLADVFEKFIKVSLNEFEINPLYCVSLPGYTWECGLKYTGINLQTLQDKDMILMLENNIRGGISSVMGDRYVKSDENKKILYIDANNLYGWAMSQYLPYDDIKFDGNVKLEDILDTPDDSEVGYFVEVDLKYPEGIREKTVNFPFCPDNKFSPQDKFTEYMKKMKQDSYAKCKKLICDWTDKKKYLIHYRMLKFYVRHGMIVEKVHEVISFKQSKWLEKYIDFNTQKRNRTKNDFEKDFYKLLNNAFYGKTMENVRNRTKIEFIKKDEEEKMVKWQSKLTFNGIHKCYEKYDSFTFKMNEVLMDKPIYLGFSVLELSKLLMYETYYDKFQPYFGKENLHCHYMDSVTGDTPIILKENRNVKILRIDEIINDENWYRDDNVISDWGEKDFGDGNGLQVWTSEGWKDIKKVIRHKTEKDIYRIRTKHGIVDVTEDHSLLNKSREVVRPRDLVLGEELLHNHFEFGAQLCVTFDEIIDKIYNTEAMSLKEKEMFVKGFFLGDGSSGVYNCSSGVKYCWTLNNLDFRIIEKLKRYADEVWNENFQIYDIRESSHVYKIASGKKMMALEFEDFYTKDKEKRIPSYILNETLENRKWFLIGFYAADGNKKRKTISFSQKNKVTMSGLNYLCQSLGLNTAIGMRDDKFNVFNLFKVNKMSDEKVHKIVNLGRKNDYVYDLQTESHDFNCGFPLIVHNTDSFVLSVNTKDIFEDLYNLRDFFDFSNLCREHKLFSEVNKKVLGKFKIETPGSIWIDEFVCLRSKAYAYRCGGESSNKLKGISKSQSKNIKFEEYYNCLFGGNYQRECENFVIRSIDHDMFLQKVTKNSLSTFDEKRCYLNNIVSIPWM